MRLGITRSNFLRGALASLAASNGAAGLGPSVLAQQLSQGTSPERLEPSLLHLEFTPVAEFRPFELLPQRFMQVHEQFPDGVASWSRVTGLHSEIDAAQVIRMPSRLRVASSRPEPTLFRMEAGPVAPFATVIVRTETELASAEPHGTVAVGLVRDASNSVVASFERGSDPARATVGIDVLSSGQKTRVASATSDLAGITRHAFVVNENYVTALALAGTEWIPVVQHRITQLLDLRDPAVLSQFRYGFGAGGTGATVTIAEVNAGYFGLAGIRDLHVVSYSDGRPYIEGRKLYFTATQAGLSFFQAAHWGVWTLDLDDLRRIEPVAALFFARDGLVLGDHAGQIVVDEHNGGFHVAVSSWGDFAFMGVHVRHCHTFENILTGVHLLTTAPLSLPTDLSAWDPALARFGGRWYVGFVESPYQDPVRGFNFRPVLARSEDGASLDRLSRIGADLSRDQTEGIILQEVGGHWYCLASDGADRRYRVYDLSMNLIGFLRAPYGSNIPHPQVVPISEQGRTTHLLITFDGVQYHEKLLGYGTHGDLIVMRAV